MVPAYEGTKPYLFVSYAHKDSAAVMPVIELLYEKKYRVWYDEGIAAGSEWPKNIADHLNAAEGYLIFTSENSLKSENCENEVVKALKKAEEGGRELIQYALTGSHEKLAAAKTVRTAEELLEILPEHFIGDGSGYERKVGRQRFGALWNGLILLAVLLAAALAAGLYGLEKGWFDEYLPGVQAAIADAEPAESVPEEQQTGIVISDQELAGLITGQLDREDLSRVLVFDSEEEKNEFYDLFGYDRSKGPMTAMYLTGQEQEEVGMQHAGSKSLSYLQYCPKLLRVYVPYTAFPLEIPPDAAYRVILH